MENDMTDIHNAARIVAAGRLKMPPVNTKSWQLSYVWGRKQRFILTLLAPSAGRQLSVTLWPLLSCSFNLSTSLWATSALCVHTWNHRLTGLLHQPHQWTNEMIRLKANTSRLWNVRARWNPSWTPPPPPPHPNRADKRSQSLIWRGQGAGLV